MPSPQSHTVAHTEGVSLHQGLTVPEFARRYRIGEDKVRGMIRRGELAAINTASRRCGRPHFVILPETLAAFERGPPAQTDAARPRRRPRRPKGMIGFFPD